MSNNEVAHLVYLQVKKTRNLLLNTPYRFVVIILIHQYIHVAVLTLSIVTIILYNVCQRNTYDVLLQQQFFLSYRENLRQYLPTSVTHLKNVHYQGGP